MKVAAIEVDAALARSAAYGLLAQAFRYPDPSHWAMFSDRGRWQDWPEILARDCPEAGAVLQRFQEGHLSPEPSRSVPIEALQADFARVFGHAVKGACPLYELEYGAGEIFQRVSRLADLKGFYSAFGLELQDRLRERPDHISVELEFMSVMTAKEAYAAQHSEAEGLRTVRESAGRFLESHLGGWLPSMARRVLEADPAGFYGALADFGDKFVRAECERYGVCAGPELLELRSIDEDDETIQTCAAEQPGASCPSAP